VTVSETRNRPGFSTSEPAQIELILSQIDTFPDLPLISTRLLQLSKDETFRIKELIPIIEADQDLTARMLSIARRSNLGAQADSIGSVFENMGFDAARSFVLTVQVFDTFTQQKGNTGCFDRLGFWQHSIAVGCAARLLAEMSQGMSKVGGFEVPKPEEAFICGFLHDIGKVLLDVCFPKSYDRVISRVEEAQGNIADVEREIFGVDHAMAGRRLAAHWKLSEMVGECIWLHHHSPAYTPSRIDYPGHVRLIQLADRIARHVAIGYSGNYRTQEPLTTVAEAAGFSMKEVDNVISMIPGLIEARAEMIGLEKLTSQEPRRGELDETTRQLQQANISLMESNYRLERRSKSLDALRVFNAAISGEPTHEKICGAFAQALHLVLPDRLLAVLIYSPNRSVVVVSLPEDKNQNSELKLLPVSSSDADHHFPKDGTTWTALSQLPDLLRDYLNGVFGEMPNWYWPVCHQKQFVGAVVILGEAISDADELWSALSDTVSAWWNVAESRYKTQQLNEELYEINRRLVDSQTEIAQARSLLMVGEMAAGAAHELNNPLTVISGRAQMLSREGMSEEVLRAAKVIADHAYRASAIVSELMDFAKPTPPQPTVWSLGELLGEVRHVWLEKNILSEGQFLLQLSDDVDKVHADASQIKKLFDEVIRNAMEAMHNVTNPILTINCRLNLADEKVVIGIGDNGAGMSPEILDRAMMPFFSYRPAGRGRGLGLSRAYRYAEINGGRIWLTSKAGEGTTVYVELPAVVKA